MGRTGRGLRLGGGWKIKLKFQFWRNLERRSHIEFWLELGLLGLELIHSPVFASVKPILTALHAMQARSSDENFVRPSVRQSVRPSVCLSVCQTRGS